MTKSHLTPCLLGCAVFLGSVATLRAQTPRAERRDRRPTNGIFVDFPKTYDDAALRALLDKAQQNLDALKGFDANKVVAGNTQGVTVDQTGAKVDVQGGKTGTPSSSSPPGSVPSFGTLSGPTLSGADVLNEQTQLAFQIAGLQLLLRGALSDQVEPRSTEPRVRSTLGFPISINVPRGFQYRNAVAEVEISVCTAEGDAGEQPTLVTILPQAKTYNVASIVSKSTQIGGAAVTQMFSVSGSFLRGRQTYYIVKDQDTVALQRPPYGDCKSIEIDPEQGPRVKTYRPLVFAWQFKPVLGQEVVQDGLRQTYVQLAFSPPKNTMSCEQRTVRIRTGWRRYDRQTGRVGAPIGEFKELVTYSPAYDNPPAPQAVLVDDNGDGKVTVRAMGSFKAGTYVRIGNKTLGQPDASTMGGVVVGTTPAQQTAEFLWTTQYIKFTAPAADIALYGARLVNADGTEWDVLRKLPPPRRNTCGALLAQTVSPATESITAKAVVGVPFTYPLGRLLDQSAEFPPILPEGLWFDRRTGIIAGVPSRAFGPTTPLRLALADGRRVNFTLEVLQPPVSESADRPTPEAALTATIAKAPAETRSEPLVEVAPPASPQAGSGPTPAARLPAQIGSAAFKQQIGMPSVQAAMTRFYADPIQRSALPPVILAPFSDTRMMVTLQDVPLLPEPAPDANGDVRPPLLPVVLIGKSVFGLRDSPFASKPQGATTADVAVFVPPDLLAVPGQTVAWTYLFEKPEPGVNFKPFRIPPNTTDDGPIPARCAVGSAITLLHVDSDKTWYAIPGQNLKKLGIVDPEPKEIKKDIGIVRFALAAPDKVQRVVFQCPGDVPVARDLPGADVKPPASAPKSYKANAKVGDKYVQVEGDGLDNVIQVFLKGKPLAFEPAGKNGFIRITEAADLTAKADSVPLSLHMKDNTNVDLTVKVVQ